MEYATQFQPYTDEQFSAESDLSLITNQDFDFVGAHEVKIYKISTGTLNDYDRAGTGSNLSRYGKIESLDATTESFLLRNDKSFTFAIDKLDQDETKQQLEAASALARQNREIVIPTIEAYTYNQMATNAGTKATAAELTKDNIYDDVLTANATLDDALCPPTGRCLIVNPTVYNLLKKSADIAMNTDIGNDIRLKGVIATLDGMNVIKVPAARLPKDFGFMVCHPSATVAPKKLESYQTHVDPPFISGSLVEGRIVYDAFVLENKAKGIYYQALKTA